MIGVVTEAIGAQERRRRGPRFNGDLMGVLEASRDLFCLTVNGAIAAINSAGLCLLAAADAEEVEGTQFLDYLIPDGAAVAAVPAFDDGWLDRNAYRPDPIRVQMRRFDGGLRDVELWIYRARELTKGAIVVLGRDVTERSQLTHAMQRTQIRFRMLVENSGHLVAHCQGGMIDYVNRAGVRMLGATDAAQLVGRPVWDLFEAKERDVLACDVGHLLAWNGNRPVGLQRLDGTRLDAQLSVTVFPCGDSTDYMIEAFDVSHHLRTMDQLRLFNEQLEQRVRERTGEIEEKHRQVEEAWRFAESLLDAVPSPVWFKDDQLRFRKYNQAFREINQVDGNAWIGKTLAEVWESDLAGEHEDMDRRMLAGGAGRQCELLSRFGDGSERDVLICKTVFHGRDGNPAGVIGMMVDISERKAMERELRRLATTDALTGSYNRRHFLASASLELDRAYRHERPVSLLMLDIDHFKAINDGFGHAAGDEALQAFVRICQDTLRDHDLIGRLGGEEFAVLLPETTLAGAVEVAERLRAQVEAHCIASPCGLLRITTSIGVCRMRPDDTVSILLQRADAALYVAKNSGRNRVCLEQ